MKKHLIILTLIFIVIFTACGTAPGSAPGQQSAVSGDFEPGFQTDSITVYDITMGESGVIMDGKLIAEIAASAQIDSWKALSDLGDQVSAVPVYALDFGNGTCIGLLGDGYITAGTAFEYLSEDYQSYRIVDGCQYQVPVEFTDLLEEVTVISVSNSETSADTAISLSPETDAEMLDNMYENIASGESDGALLEKIKLEESDVVLEYLMTRFLGGALEGCQFNDGSTASLQYAAWAEMLGGEIISLETENPQSYWESWCEHIERLYEANGYEFFVEQDYPVSAKYIELKYGIDG